MCSGLSSKPGYSCTIEQLGDFMTQPESVSGQRLVFLFDLALEHRQGMQRASPGRGELGEYLSSGEGSAFGPRLNGIVRWDLFQEEDPFCRRANLRGFIKTDDAARIEFDALGYYKHMAQAQPTLWNAVAAVRFETDARQYTWLNAVLGLWHGEFDMGSLRHDYRVYAQGSG